MNAQRCFCLSLLCQALTANAADHLNLEEGLPVTVEDAYTLPYRGREIQGRLDYERTDDGRDFPGMEPRLEVGLMRNFQAAIKVPYHWGNARDSDRGDVEVEGLYNFNAETLTLPALALSGTVRTPIGRGDEPVETELKGILTRSLGGYVPRRVHVNLSWLHLYGDSARERSDRYVAVLGYSQPITADTVLVADLVRKQDREEGVDQNLVEAGIRTQLTPLALLTLGVGVGLGDDSPDYRVMLGFQYSLTVPRLYRADDVVAP